MTPEEVVLRAEKARQLLEEPLIKEFLDALERDVADAWKRCPIRDKEGQHELLLMVQTVLKFKALFAKCLADGEVAKADLRPPRITRVLERFGVRNPY